MTESLLSNKNKEIYDMQCVIEELKELHDEVVAEKDNEILSTQVELAFCNESLAAKDEELHQTKTELMCTQISLQAANASIQESKQILLEKENELSELEKAYHKGKRSAQAIMGMLTLGALLTDDK